MEVSTAGEVTARVGATLVKDSVPIEEVRETEAKIRGVISALKRSLAENGSAPATTTRPPRLADLFVDEAGMQLLNKHLHDRNNFVSKLWRIPTEETANLIEALQMPSEQLESLIGKSVLLMDNEDDFIHMSHHMMQKLGMKAKTVKWNEFDSAWMSGYHVDNFQKPQPGVHVPWDIVVVGPGPGDPRSDHPKMVSVRQSVKQLRQSPQKFLCICLGHQCLAHELKLELVKKKVPLQGVQRLVNLFGEPQKLGFYNSFHVSAGSAQETKLDVPVELCVDDGEVIAMKGDRFTSFQFHPESILSQHGIKIIVDTLSSLLTKAK